MTNWKHVTYCGLYCGLCTTNCRIPKQARELKNTMQREGYDDWGHNIPGFTDFWKYLNNLVESESKNSCREGNCGAPFCTIRKCASEKKIDMCISCEEYPCNRIEGIAKGYPTLLADGKRIRDIGIDAWIEEQKERAEAGFAYSDIRCYPYEVPDK